MNKLESKAVLDVYAARELIYNETKHMTVDERHAYYKKLSDEAVKKYSLPPAMKLQTNN